MTKPQQLSRRTLLKSGAMALFGAAAGPLPIFMPSAIAQGRAARPKVLVTIFQRFGMDGLLAVAPYADQRLAALRPTMMLSAPGSGKADARLDLGEGYGLHPTLAPLLPFYRDGRLAVIQAAGSPHNTRSHTEAQLWWESGAPGDRAQRDGWLNRVMTATGNTQAALLPAVAVGDQRPRIFYGDRAVTTVKDLDALKLSGAAQRAQLEKLQALYQLQGPVALRDSTINALELSRVLAAQTPGSTNYPEGSMLGSSLRDIAALIKADVGLQLAFTESRNSPDGKGTWDTHSNAGAMDGPFPRMAADFANSVAAFMDDLGSYRDDVVIVTLTDFGRNVVENERKGADHGRATAMFVLGSNIQGGQVYGQLPERFERDALEDGMDLPVTTDYRAVLSSLTQAQFGVDGSQVFPGWQGGALPIIRA